MPLPLQPPEEFAMLTSNPSGMPFIGGRFARVDGPLKVTGRAEYSSDYNFPGLLYAVPVCATISTGKITHMDTSHAIKMPGVHEIFTRANIGPLQRVPKHNHGQMILDEHRPPLADDVIRYWGQYVAVVVADTFEQATAAARRVHVEYDAHTPDVRMAMTTGGKTDIDSHRGDTQTGFSTAPVKIDQTYSTPIETHNPIELHASVATWDGHNFTLYETTQSIMNHRRVMAAMLGVPVERMRIVMKFLGSGFGGKLWPWPHALLAAAAARNLERPIKLVVSRKMMFEDVGHRPNTQQRMRLGADHDGRLLSLQQDYLCSTAPNENNKEPCGEATPFLYSTPNLRVTGGLVRRDIAPSTAMRGPGAVPGLFAVESAMDELAVALDMDPVQLRQRNEPKIDESRNVPFSSRHMSECLSEGAKKFGWDKRNPKIGSMREGDTILGWGMASCAWMAARLPADVSVELHADNTARVLSATQDIGTGTYTVLAQLVAEYTGIPLDRITVDIGDSKLPPGPLSGGSMVTASVIPATKQAAEAALHQVMQAATQPGAAFAGTAMDELRVENGRVRRKGDAGNGRSLGSILADAHLDRVSGKGSSKSSSKDADADKLSFHSYGTHFVEVRWQPRIARLRVHRLVTMIDGGRIINERTARNQIEGAIVMGVGMALFEQTEYDARSGAPINSNLADYLVATHADQPALDVTFLDYPDYALNPLGARGVGEIGLAGVAPAIANAVYHATGVRVRQLPIRIEDLLQSRVSV
jgi:xanthine dehydrogenase YagR molybdenum-binding subunit